MSTFVFALLAGVLAGCMILSVGMMAADLWLRWKQWREDHPDKKRPPESR